MAITPFAHGDATPSLIPWPSQVEVGEGRFTITAATVVQHGLDLLPEATLLADALEPAMGWRLHLAESTSSDDARAAILLQLDPGNSALGSEGYTLSVTEKGVIITGARPAGVFYGIQTLRQLLPVDIFQESPIETEWTLSFVSILDTPRFPWRGHLFDVCRHYFDKETVLRQIDLLAMHKMNVLHWHLTEDQAWRIEILRYPKLTEIGAWRPAADGTTYGGFYTREDIREVVEYAARRHVTVVPEIELPGHSMAALAAYPHLGCTGGPYEVATTWGIFPDVYCAGNDATMEFVRNVLDEVLELFPSASIHIGGDECPKDRWRECVRCQERIDNEGLADEDELQSWFITQVGNYLDERSRRLIGWDEILEGGLAPGAIVQSWRGTRGGIAAAREGNDVIMSPTSHCYLDYSHTTISLEKAYSFEPIPEELGDELAHHVLGLEGNMWTEWVPTRDRLDHQVWPRLTALAEVAWSPRDARDWEGFQQRMSPHFRRFEILGVKYAREHAGMDLSGATNVARWLPEQMSEEPAILEWDFTQLVTGPGDYDVIFFYTSGANALEIYWAALLKDGVVVARDEHLGWSGANKRDVLYRLSLDDYDPDAQYILRVNAASRGGTNSSGDVRLRAPK